MRNLNKAIQFVSRFQFVFILALAITTLSVVVSCKTSKHAAATDNTTKVVAMSEGQEIYTNRCGRCHKLFPVANFTAEQWKVNLDKMRGKAKLTDQEYSSVSKYLSENHK